MWTVYVKSCSCLFTAAYKISKDKSLENIFHLHQVKFVKLNMYKITKMRSHKGCDLIEAFLWLVINVGHYFFSKDKSSHFKIQVVTECPTARVKF